jgi:flagellar export protein FliJ
MNQFKFRLQSVQKLRERLRDEAADALQQAHLAIQKLNGQLAQFDTEMNEQARLQHQLSDGVINTHKVLESQRYQMHLLAEIQQVKHNIELIQQECQRRQLVLIKREQDVRALEKLRDSQAEQWQQEQLILQQSRMDEWAGFRHWNQTNKE